MPQTINCSCSAYHHHIQPRLSTWNITSWSYSFPFNVMRCVSSLSIKMCTFGCFSDWNSVSINWIRLWDQVERLSPEGSQVILYPNYGPAEPGRRGINPQDPGGTTTGQSASELLCYSAHQHSTSLALTESLLGLSGVEGLVKILSHSLLTGSERRGHSLLVPGCTFTAVGLGECQSKCHRCIAMHLQRDSPIMF